MLTLTWPQGPNLTPCKTAAYCRSGVTEISFRAQQRIEYCWVSRCVIQLQAERVFVTTNRTTWLLYVIDDVIVHFRAVAEPRVGKGTWVEARAPTSATARLWICRNSKSLGWWGGGVDGMGVILVDSERTCVIWSMFKVLYGLKNAAPD